MMVVHFQDLSAIHLALGVGAGIQEGPILILIQGKVDCKN